MSIATRIKSAEAHLPKPPDSAAEKLRARLMHASEAAFFAGIFGGRADYLAAAECFQRGDRDGAVAIAELVDKRTDGVAGIAFIGLDLAPVAEKLIIRLQDLLKISHPLDATAIAEIRAIICSALPDDYGFPQFEIGTYSGT
jgi:hypothetical protein